MPSVGEATPRTAAACARRAAPDTTSAESSPPSPTPSSSRCASAAWPARCSRPGGQHGGARRELRLVGHRHAGEALGLPRPAGDVGDHAGVQRVQHAEAVALDRRAEGRQGLLGLAAAHLRPGEQHRLHELHRPAAGHAADPLLRPFPAAGLGVGAGQQQVGDRVVRQAPGEAQRVAPPVQQGGEEGAAEQLRLVRVGAQRGEEAVGGDRACRFGRGEAPGQVGAEGPVDRRSAAAAAARARRPCLRRRRRPKGARPRGAPSAAGSHDAAWPKP